MLRTEIHEGCISFDSYIKPQLGILASQFPICCISFDSYIKPQLVRLVPLRLTVVYLLIPTSNHNSSVVRTTGYPLYIFWFLHQTTTGLAMLIIWIRCISFDSYIKPQLWSCLRPWQRVVYLLIPTSNHNSMVLAPNVRMLYIFWFLHQTTTYRI